MKLSGLPPTSCLLVLKYCSQKPSIYPSFSTSQQISHLYEAKQMFTFSYFHFHILRYGRGRQDFELNYSTPNIKI